MADFQGALDLLFASRSSNSTSIHHFYDLTTVKLRYKSFDNHLEDEPWDPESPKCAIKLSNFKGKIEHCRTLQKVVVCILLN